MFKMISLFSILSAVIFISCPHVNAMEEAAKAADPKPSRTVTIVANLTPELKMYTLKEWKEAESKFLKYNPGKIFNPFIHPGTLSILARKGPSLHGYSYDKENNQVTFKLDLNKHALISHNLATINFNVWVYPKRFREYRPEHDSYYFLNYQVSCPLTNLDSVRKIIVNPTSNSEHGMRIDPSLPKFILITK